MAGDKITIALDGDIPLQSLADALTQLNRLVGGLAAEVAGVPIDWIVDELSFGSAVATVKGYADDTEPVLRAVAASETVFRAIENHTPIPFSRKVSRPAAELAELVGGRVIALHFYTSEEFQATIRADEGISGGRVLYRHGIGRVEGVVENLFRRSARFMLTDKVSHRPVSCHFARGQEEVMRDIWGHPAAVTGWVTRDAATGRPLVVEHITEVQPIQEPTPGLFRRARGALARSAEGESPVDLIRKLRDGS